MSRLIAFGDSFTFGQYLEDPTGCKQERLAWPKILGDMLGYNVVNTALPGHSNIEILRAILNFDFQHDDLVIVSWTYALRDYIFRKNILGIDTSVQVNAWHKDTKFIEKWAEVHNDYDLSIRAGLYMHHAECFLKTKNINQKHFCAFWGFWEVMPNFTVTPKTFINENILLVVDKALDNSHPGPVSHYQAAERLYKILNETK